MADRFDHLAVLVPDLDAAVATYQEAGFAVQPGGRHPDLGTQNSLIRFGKGYLELFTVWDRERAAARGPFGQAILDALEARPNGGLAAYVLGTADIDEDAERLRAAGIRFEGPFSMGRKRPDGNELAWRLLIPYGLGWRQPWPILIEWVTPEEVRSSWEPIPEHPNGARGFARIEVLVRDLEESRRLHEDGLGLEPQTGPGPGDGRTGYWVGETWIELIAAKDDARRETLATFGEGPDRSWLHGTIPGARLEGDPVRHGIQFEGAD